MPDSTPPNDPFEMFRRLWGPLGVPVPGLAMPTLDPAEVERRIADMKAVEGWLSMNLNMLRMAIQGLEAQKTALQAMHAATEAGKVAAAGAAQQVHPMIWPWNAMHEALGAGAQSADPTNDNRKKESKP
ncbi:MAG TPA: PhaM family polyhydroxyalkanoate granule multifunctional regulatory protein [Sphingomonadaceae bacterium]|nr:PhaM family polyhydroxyalkanoate granule multifunctional regulatory protein [Sphingomonadaceae bacterium]